MMQNTFSNTSYVNPALFTSVLLALAFYLLFSARARIRKHFQLKRIQTREELIRVKELVKESARAKERFQANVSHEMRTPMNAIVGFTDLLRKTELNEEQKQYADAIKISAENLLIITNDILDFSKLTSGRIEFEQIPFRPLQIVSALSEMMLPKATEKNITLRILNDETLPNYLVGDPSRLNQILQHLTDNAIKFTQKGEVVIGVALREELADEVELEFSVQDTGIGIPEDLLGYIFDSYHQVHNDSTRKYGGTGLGLAIVKQLIELQGGQIFVSSKPGEGSCFSFRIRYKKSLSAHGHEDGLPEETGATEFLKGLKILLVEDNVLNQLLARKVLNNWGCEVDVAENGKVAIQKLEKQNFDLILMDIQLPEMNGYEASKYIREHFPDPKCNISIIAMTAHAFSGEKEKCLKAGMDDYLSKPFNQDILRSKIVSVVSERQSRKKESFVRPVRNSNSSSPKHINLEYLKQLSEGDNEFIAEMIALFIEQTPGEIEKLEIYLLRKDWDAMRLLSHKLRSSVSFAGIKELEELLLSTEDYTENEIHLDQLPGLISQIRQICFKAISELEQELKSFI
jgi:signal transduction histidine kinase/CheY-like chemotaxis protein/HPt (histidine-containing phosphotransfer) domain-containing protein